MKPILLLSTILGFWILSGTAHAETAVVILEATQGDSAVSGKVVLVEEPDGLRIQAKVQGARPGKHGFHVHQYGSCEEGGKAAGGHFNPDEMLHGSVLTASVFESHPGDLGNIQIQDNGIGTLDVTVPDLGLSDGIYNVAGRAMILHEKEDTFIQPTGGAGSRIACGKILMVKDAE